MFMTYVLVNKNKMNWQLDLNLLSGKLSYVEKESLKPYSQAKANDFNLQKSWRYQWIPVWLSFEALRQVCISSIT